MKAVMKKASVYIVFRLEQSMKIDGKWDKTQWQDINAIETNKYTWETYLYRRIPGKNIQRQRSG